MPETHYTNGYSQAGFNGANESHDGEKFLFSSESVGEGHPGKLKTICTQYKVLRRRLWERSQNNIS